MLKTDIKMENQKIAVKSIDLCQKTGKCMKKIKKRKNISKTNTILKG